MIFVLIIFFSGNNLNGATVSSVEFNNREACEQARANILKSDIYKAQMICAEKGRI